MTPVGKSGRGGRPLQRSSARPVQGQDLTKKQWDNLVDALAYEGRTAADGIGPRAAALAEKMFPTPPVLGQEVTSPRNATGREREAVDRWLRSRRLSERLSTANALAQAIVEQYQAVSGRSPENPFKRYENAHRNASRRLREFAADPQNPTALAGAVEALQSLPAPDQDTINEERQIIQAFPEGWQGPHLPDSFRPPPAWHRTLTVERLQSAVGHQGALQALAYEALMLANHCDDIVMDIKDWRKIMQGRSGENTEFARESAEAKQIALLVAAFFAAAETKRGKVPDLLAQGARLSRPYDNGKPSNPYTRTCAAAIVAVLGGKAKTLWQPATRAALRQLKSSRPSD